MIPGWNAEGLIPPIDEQSPAGLERSPYETDLISFVHHFATSMERCLILEGYLEHRTELHSMGMDEGFQWLDGSFTENIELIERRAPNDIDVVTFTPADDIFYEGLSHEQSRLLGLTRDDKAYVKGRYKVDFYVQSLSDAPELLVEMTSYWYSMWAHRRSKQWKGFLRIDLNPWQDQAALDALNAKKRELSHDQE